MKSNLFIAAAFTYLFFFQNKAMALEDAIATPILEGLRQAGYQVEMREPVNESTIAMVSRNNVYIEVSLYKMPTLEKARDASSYSMPMVSMGVYLLFDNQANSAWVHRRYMGGHKQLLVFYAKAESGDLLTDQTNALKQLFAALKPFLPSVNSVSTVRNHAVEPAALDAIRAAFSRAGFVVATIPGVKNDSRFQLSKGDIIVELSLAHADSPQNARAQSEIAQPMEDGVKLLSANRDLYLWTHPEFFGAQKGSAVIQMKFVKGSQPELLRQIFDLISPLLP